MASSSKAFDMGKMAIGGIGQVLDSVEFVKRAWSTLNIPSTMVPTVDVEELDKRIADLKAVEQWLNVNLSMLHGTIQGLEIQRGTLAAVKAFGATLGNLGGGQDDGAARARHATRGVPEAFMPKSPAAAPTATPPMPAMPDVPPTPEPSAASPAAKPGKAGAAKVELPAMLPGINPTAWWNLLQQNFNQVAQAALAGGLQGVAVGAAKGAGPSAAASKPARAAKAPARRGAPKKKGAPPKPRAPRGGE